MGRAALVVMFLNGIAIIAAFGREMLIAYYFGTSAELDAFLVAYSVPRFVGESLAIASVTALIPVFAKIRSEEGDGAMVSKISNIAIINFTALTLFTLLYILVAPFIIRLLAPGFEEERYNLAVKLTIYLAPTTILWGLFGVLKAVQNSFRRFTFPELARPLVSLVIITTLIVFARPYGDYLPGKLSVSPPP